MHFQKVKASDTSASAMERLETQVGGVTSVKSVTLQSPPLDPEAVLDRSIPGSRGFWARGERWVIHWGAVARLELDGSEEVGDRFARIQEESGAVFDRIHETVDCDVDASRPPRFYGGFSFRDRIDDPDPCWRAFGSASFILSGVEIAGRPDRARITVRSAGREESEEELLERARLLAEELRGRSGGRAASSVDGPSGSPGMLSSTAPRREESEPTQWRAAVDEAIDWIGKGRLSKVVLARTLDFLADDLPDPATVVLNLRRQNPGTHVFLFEPAPGAALVGAAPETVATVLGGAFKATAVAGSIARGRSPAEQEALALKLLESGKDRVEHSIAVDDMVRRLRPVVRDLSWDTEPHVITLSRIQHLETCIQATLPDDASVLEILGALHPTPAVCGLPRDAALDFLRMEEPFDRGWYAGPVGWFNSDGEGVFAPALRCAVLIRGRWRLFAGAGIVSESEPELEWEETRIKFEPMVRALQASGESEAR